MTTKNNGLITNFKIFTTYQIYDLLVNPFGKIIFYFMAFLNSVYLKGNDPYLTILFFIPTILFIDCIITILINPELNSKQKDSLKNIFKIVVSLFSIPFIASFFQIFSFLFPISFTFIILGFVYLLGTVSQKIDNYTKRTGNVLFSGLIICLLISFLYFGKINDPFLINFLLFSSVSILLVRLIDFFPKLHFPLEKDTEEYIKKHKKFNDRLILIKNRYFRDFKCPIIINDEICFNNSGIRNEKGNLVKNKKKITKINKLLKYKENLVSIKNENKRRMLIRRFFFPISFPLFVILNNKTALLQQSKWFYRNYDKIPDFILKTKEDKELHKRDAEMQIGFEILEEKIYNINVLVNMYFEIPSNILFDLIQKKVKNSLKYTTQNLSPIINRRLELAKIDIKKRQGEKATKESIEKSMKRQLYYATSNRLKNIVKSLEKLKI